MAYSIEYLMKNAHSTTDYKPVFDQIADFLNRHPDYKNERKMWSLAGAGYKHIGPLGEYLRDNKEIPSLPVNITDSTVTVPVKKYADDDITVIECERVVRWDSFENDLELYLRNCKTIVKFATVAEYEEYAKQYNCGKYWDNSERDSDKPIACYEYPLKSNYVAK